MTYSARPGTGDFCNPSRPAYLPREATERRSHERGYTLITVIFLVALMMIAATEAVINVKTAGLREREAETIWRGNQYKIGIRRYFQKFNRYPQSTDDLVKPTNGIRFMGQAYKDPSNPVDGEWRMIYVVPATGQLLGSVRYFSLAQMAALDGAGGASPLTGLPGVPGATAIPGATLPNGQPAGSDQNAQNPGQSALGGQNPPLPGAPQISGQADQQPQALETSGPVFGGSIIGVGCKMNKNSVKVYKGGKKYRQWEFIWNPLEPQPGASQPGTLIGTPAGQISSPVNGTQNPSPNGPPQPPPPPGQELPPQ